MYSQKWNCTASFPSPTFMYLWAISLLFPGSICLLVCRKMDRQILGIYKSLTDTWMWKLGDRHYNSVLAVSFLGIHKSEPDIYIGFSMTLHMQCVASRWILMSDRGWFGHYREISLQKLPGDRRTVRLKGSDAKEVTWCKGQGVYGDTILFLIGLNLIRKADRMYWW